VGNKYAHAPIVEAGIDFHVSGDPSLKVEDLASILEPPEYPERREVYEVSTSEWNEAGERIASRTVSGYRALSSDRSHGVVVTPDQYSFSLLSHYEDWGQFLAAAEQGWAVYRKVASPQTVTAASVRFVNLIEVPKEQYEIRDYLRTSFDVSPYLPQVVLSFYSQVDIPLEGVFEGFSPTCSLTVSSTPPDQSGMILDIAVSVGVDLDTQKPDFGDALSEILTKLRHAKNYVFESCITDATRNLIS
jgi:uncharacterized protein (TIGR04255 family)